jgi:hypothetical protein
MMVYVLVLICFSAVEAASGQTVVMPVKSVEEIALAKAAVATLLDPWV